MVRPAFLDWIFPSGDNLVLVPCRRGFWVGMLGLLVGAIPVAAQPLDSPLRTVSCDPARSPLYQSGSDLKAACEQRVYELPATDSLALKQDKYDGVFVEAWDSSATVMEAIIVMRKPTQSEATAALSDVKFRWRNGRIQSNGPDGDAPGWWSVRYRVRVPRQTTLALMSGSGSIQVQGVIGSHRLMSDDGALTLHLPSDAGARLLAETDYGTIDVGFPVTVQGPISHRLDTVVGGGGPTVQLTTGDDITIRRNK